MSQTFNLTGLKPDLPKTAPAPPNALDAMVPPLTMVPRPPLPNETAPKSKGGRPKGIPKVKKTFYLATDLTRLEDTQINLARHVGLLTKDESDTVDLALELLDYLAGLPEYAELINTIHKKRLSR